MNIAMSGTRVTIRTGDEGPQHDPYSWREVCVVRLGRRVTLRAGLSCWLEIEWNGEKRHLDERDVVLADDDIDKFDALCKMFEAHTGMTPSDAEEYHHRAQNTCSCGWHGDAVYLGGGYVGESMYGCPRCENVLYDDFHMSMIE